MFKNRDQIEKRVTDFFNNLEKQSQIYIPMDEKQVPAMLQSLEFEDKEGPLNVVCIWSDEKLARVSLKKNWPNYTLKKIDVAEFIEQFLVYLHNEEIYSVGINFDWNLYGREFEPLEVLSRSVKQLLKKNIHLKLKHHESLESFNQDLKQITPS